MATRKKMKWAVGSAEPEDLPDFRTNAEIGKPPRGLYHFRIQRIKVTTNRNDDEMLKIYLIIEETNAKRKKWNGYFIVDNQNVTDDSAAYLKRFLTAVGVTWKEFINSTVLDTTQEPPEISKIGDVKFDSAKRPVMVWATTADDEYEGEKRLKIGRYVKPVNDPDEDSADEPDDDDDVPADDDDDVQVDDDTDEPDADEPDDDDGMEMDEDELREELEDLDAKELRARLKEDGVKVAEYKGKRKPTLIDMIVAVEMPEEDEPDDDEGEPDDDEPEDDLDDIDDVATLKSRARAAGLKLSQLKGHSKAEVRDMIREAEAASPF